MRKFSIQLFVFLLSFNLAFSQSSGSPNKVDSSQVRRMDGDLNKVSQLSAERLSDSLKRSAIELKVEGLQTTDIIERKRLLVELKLLRKKDSVQQQHQIKQIDSLRKFIKGAPVVFNRDTLFYIYAKLGSFTAQDRAQAVVSRLEKISADRVFYADSLKANMAENASDLIYRKNLLLSVTVEDAIWANKDVKLYATILKDKMTASLSKYSRENSWQVFFKEILLTLLVITVVVGLIYFVNRIFKVLLGKIMTSEGKLNQGIKIKNYQLLDADRQFGAIKILLSAVRWAIILILIYLALPVLFGIFPFTKNLSESLLNYILSPLKKVGLAIWNYIPNLMTILVLLVIFKYVLRFLRFIKSEVELGNLTIPGFYKDWANPTFQITRALILAFMLVVIFPYLPGSDSDIFKGVSVFMGVLFTFGSAGALSNVVAGLVLTYMRAFKIGDRVKIGEVTGDILEKTLLVTRVRTVQNEVVTIPNSAVMSNHTINFSSEGKKNGLIIYTTVTIGYDVPWRKIYQLLTNAALKTALIEQDPQPFVLQTSLDDYYVSYQINAYTKFPNKQGIIYSNLHANIQDLFNEAGVEIMSPHYRAVRDGNTTTVPEAGLSDV